MEYSNYGARYAREYTTAQAGARGRALLLPFEQPAGKFPAGHVSGGIPWKEPPDGYSPDTLLKKIIRPHMDDDTPVPAEQPRQAQFPHFPASERPAPPVSPRVSLQEEFPAAQSAYAAASAFMKTLFIGASRNRLELDGVQRILKPIVDSLHRNPDALLSIPRLRSCGTYVCTHSLNVGILMAAFAVHQGKTNGQTALAALAGFLHDIGMALLPLALLGSRKGLSNTEKVLVMRHPMLSCELLSQAEKLGKDVFLAALDHHEHFDGSGYPNGKSKSGVSSVGQLTAIAGSYDAMSSNRPFRRALHPHKALCAMFQMKGKQFHPELLERFVRMVGVYPVGSIVELKDGYKGVVSASFANDPIHPVVVLVKDPRGNKMPRHECDLGKDGVAAIRRCLTPESSGIDPCQALGLAQ